MVAVFCFGAALLVALTGAGVFPGSPSPTGSTRRGWRFMGGVLAAISGFFFDSWATAGRTLTEGGPATSMGRGSRGHQLNTNVTATQAIAR